jgi:Protein of unknown function (DUF1573)
MTRCRIALYVLICLLTAWPAAGSGIKITGPVIEVSPLFHDFGELPQETVRRLNVTLRNVGTEMLEINNVESDCNCAVAMLADTLLAPGDSTLLHVSLSSKHASGHIIKKVMIQSTDPGAPQMVVSLTAFVRTVVAMKPSNIEFGLVARGDSPTLSTTISAATADSLRVTEVVVPEETLTYKITDTTDADSLRYRIDFTIKPDAPVGEFHDRISVSTNVRNFESLPMRLRGQIHGFFQTRPARLSLGQIREGKARQRSVTLKACTEGSRHVIGVSINSEELTASFTAVEEGRVYEVSVTAPATLTRGSYRAVLKIDTDDPDQPEIKVPVSVKVRGSK